MTHDGDNLYRVALAVEKADRLRGREKDGQLGRAEEDGEDAP